MTTPNFEDKNLWTQVSASALADHVGDWLSYSGHLKTGGLPTWGEILAVTVDEVEGGELVSVTIVGGTRVHRYVGTDQVLVVEA